MINLHKIAKQLFNLSHDDRSKLYHIIGIMGEAEKDFDKVGVPLTYDAFKKYVRKYYKDYKPIPKWLLEELKIIEGTNLDKIEEEAEKKGLL